jgi:hypothetical protein
MDEIDTHALDKAAEAVFRTEHPNPDIDTRIAPDWPNLHPVYKGVWLMYAEVAVRAYLDNAAIVMDGGGP